MSKNISMKISVIIPTYKPKDYLWECLDSLVEQTFSKDNFEVIIVLNGCCEPWNKEIESYMASKMYGMNVNFIQTDIPGVSNARNIALDNARGEYVTFIDDDDFVSPKFLEGLYDIVTPETISLSYPYVFNDGFTDKELPHPIVNEYDFCLRNDKVIALHKIRKFFSGPWMKLIPMSFIQGRRYDVRFKNGEDSLFMFLISDKIKNISVSSKDVIYYRRCREGSAVTTHRTRIVVIKNLVRLIWEYTLIYIKAPNSYSFRFFLSKILGSIKTMFL